MTVLAEASDKLDTAELDEALSKLMSSDPEAIVDPYPVWTRLRSEAPVHRFGNAVLFSTARGIKKIINDPRATHNTYGSGPRAEAIRAALPPDGQEAFDAITAFEAMYMSRNDGEVHDRLRRIAQRTFTPKRIAQINASVEAKAEAFLAEASQEPVTDFMRFAYRLPLHIIGDLLAIPEADLDMVHGWSSKLGRNRGGTELEPLLEAHQALIEFRAYVEVIIDGLKGRANTGEEIDLVGDLLDANLGDSLTDSELAAMFVVLLFAGHETTTNLIGTGLMSLLRTGQWAELRDNPAGIPRAVEELVRFVSPVQWLGRNIAEPMEVEGYHLDEGETVLLMIAAGNRDPELFEDGDRLDVKRENAKYHLGFGRGGHVCLGSHLAQMEAIVAFTLLAKRFPDLELAADTFEWAGNAKLRGLVSLPIRLGEERRD